MSRTDKTKPFWVKVLHGDLASREVHDHTDGVCDLPPVGDEYAYTYRTTQCYRDFVYTGTRTCCCVMCRGDFKPDNRRARRLARRTDWLAEY